MSFLYKRSRAVWAAVWEIIIIQAISLLFISLYLFNYLFISLYISLYLFFQHIGLRQVVHRIEMASDCGKSCIRIDMALVRRDVFAGVNAVGIDPDVN